MPVTISIVGPRGATERLDLASLLSPARQDRARLEANRWIKRLRLARYGDASMRERFTFRGDSLWWFTELYLHKMRRLEQALSTIFALETAVETHGPQRMSVECHSASAAEAARAFGRARRVAVDVVSSGTTQRTGAGFMVGVSAMLSRLRPVMRPIAPRARVATFVHTAFWKSDDARMNAGRETYIGPVLDAMGERLAEGDLRLIGVGPRRNFRARRWWDPLTGAGGGRRVTPIEQLAPRRALAESLALWRNRNTLATAIVTGDDIRAAGVWGEYDLWPVLSAELQDAARVQWPWSARAMDEARAALLATDPDVAVTYAEAGGWGRALVLEARRLSIPTVGLQHGFIYRHWLNYQHEADELQSAGADAGFPHPTRTLVFDRYAAVTLETAGHFPADAVRVTGSPQLDDLVARLTRLQQERPSIRRAMGIDDDQHLIVLAAKGTEIGPHLPALFDAVRALPGVRLVIKPHPAETRDIYLRHCQAGDGIVVDDPYADLGRLLTAADGLVTMNSTVAVDSLVLGVPALVIGLPNNLSPFVEAGAMIGADGDAIRPALEALLYDRAARAALLQRGASFAEAHQIRADGGSAARAAEAILSLRRDRS